MKWTMANKGPLLSLVVLLLFAGGVHAQLISVAFDPPRELGLGPLDTLADPMLHKEMRGLSLDIDLDTVADVGFKLAYALEMGIWSGGPENRHRLACGSIEFGDEAASGLDHVLTEDSLASGLFSFSPWDILDLDFSAGTPEGIRYIPFAVPVGTAHRYGWLRAAWEGDRFQFYGWQLQDSLDLADPLGAAPTARAQHAAPAFMIQANDVAETGTGTDLQVAFRRNPGEIGVAEYRVMLIAAAQSDTFDRADALAVPATRYRSHLPDGSNPVIAYSGADFDVQGMPIAQNQNYRVLVLSMPDGVAATQASLSMGAPIQLRLRANAPQQILLQDSLDLIASNDFFLEFEAPSYEGNVAGYWCALEPMPGAYAAMDPPAYAGLDADSILDLPMDRRFFVPASGASSYALHFPAGLKDTRGSSLVKDRRYRAVVATEPVPGAADFSFAHQSDWIELGFPTRIPTGFDHDGLGNHEDGRFMRAEFFAPLDEVGIAEYRLVTETWMTLEEEDILGLPASHYVSIVPDGSTSYRADWGGTLDGNGNPMELGTSYRMYLMVVGDSITMNGTVLLYNIFSELGSIAGCTPPLPSAVLTAGTGSPSDVDVGQAIPSDSVGLSSMRFAIVPMDSVLTPDAMLSLPAGNRWERAPNILNAPIPAGMLDAYGQNLVLGAPYRIQSQFIPDGVDASVYPVSLPSASFVLNNTNASVQDLEAADEGAAGTGRDIKVRFDAAMDESSIVAYRIVAQDGVSSLSALDIESAASGRYIEVLPGSPSHQASLQGMLQLDGSPIGAPGAYRVQVGSMNAAGQAIGIEGWTVFLTDQELVVQDLHWQDVADYQSARDFEVFYECPQLAGLRCQLPPVDTCQFTASPSLEELMAAPAAFRIELPATASPIDTILPATLLDYSGSALLEDAGYTVAMASKVVLDDTTRYVLSSSSGIGFRFDEWPANGMCKPCPPPIP